MPDTIIIDGRDVTFAEPAARDVTFVFQHTRSIRTFPSTTISPFRCARRRAACRSREIARRVERDRAAAAHRRQAEEPRDAAFRRRDATRRDRPRARPPAVVYLMDEPLSSLDAKLRADLRLELKHIQQELGATILYVTHDQIEAMTMANRIGVMDERPADAGRHAARDLREPGDVYVADPARPAGDQPHSAGLSRTAALPARRETIGARTEHLRIAKAVNGEALGDGRLDRASRRPEPPACQRRRAQSGDAGRSRQLGALR